jgi:hypothetical protein
MVKTDEGSKTGTEGKTMQENKNEWHWGRGTRSWSAIARSVGRWKGNRNEGRAARMNMLISHAATSCSEHRRSTARPSGETQLKKGDE